MIKHIVAWKLKENAEGKSRKENLALLKQKFTGFQRTIPVIKNLEVGLNADQTSKENWDIVLIIEFATFSDLEIYQRHPEHLKVGEFVKLVRESRSCVDF
jgi:hypothetical protein